jgi:hypothetical protein
MKHLRPIVLALCLLAPSHLLAEKEKPVNKEAEKSGMLAETVGPMRAARSSTPIFP